MSVSNLFSMMACKRKVLPSLAVLVLAGACFFGSAQHARAGLPDAVQLYTGYWNGPYYAANTIVYVVPNPIVGCYYNAWTQGPLYLYGGSPGWTVVYVLVYTAGGQYLWHPIQARVH